MQSSLILLALISLFAAAAFADSIALPVQHYQRPDKWWEKETFRKRDTPAGLNNFRPPDVWTVAVSLGTPAQTVNVNIDTGSTDLLVSVDGCDSCSAVDSVRFHYSASSSFTPLPCGDDRCSENCVDCARSKADNCLFNDTYGDGSWAAGEVATDIIAIGNLSSSSPLTFGVIEVTVPDFYDNGQISGIFGLAFDASSCWGQKSALHSLFDQNPTIPRSFSLCLLPTGGLMNIGESFGSNSAPSGISYLWTPYITGDGFPGYGVTLADIQVGGSSLEVDLEDPPIVDSGTTLTHLPERAYSALQTRMLSACSGSVCDLFNSENDNYLPASLSDIQKLPSITFQFSGVALTLAPAQYLLAADSSQDMWFFTFVPTSGIGIIGNQFMKYFRTAFDMDGQRIGFAAISTCPGGSSTTVGATATSGAAPSTSSTTSSGTVASGTVASGTTTSRTRPPIEETTGGAASATLCFALLAAALMLLLLA